MSDFLERLVVRSLGAVPPAVRPRLPSFFEQAAPGMTEFDRPGLKAQTLHRVEDQAAEAGLAETELFENTRPPTQAQLNQLAPASQANNHPSTNRIDTTHSSKPDGDAGAILNKKLTPTFPTHRLFEIETEPLRSTQNTRLPGLRAVEANQQISRLDDENYQDQDVTRPALYTDKNAGSKPAFASPNPGYPPPNPFELAQGDQANTTAPTSSGSPTERIKPSISAGRAATGEESLEQILARLSEAKEFSATESAPAVTALPALQPQALPFLPQSETAGKPALVRVEIGRVLVQVGQANKEAQRTSQQKKSTPRTPPVSLDAYLKERSGTPATPVLGPGRAHGDKR